MAGGSVPSTARLEFAKRLQELYEAADRPDLTAVAKRSGVTDRKGKPSNKPISAWMSPSGHHPGSWRTFRPVLKDLIRLAAEERAFTARNAALGDEDQWKRWYQNAVSSGRARPRRPGSTPRARRTLPNCGDGTHSSPSSPPRNRRSAPIHSG